MTRGRRPAGICGAALLLAARMNNFRRSVEEIVQVVKIADTTLKKRLEEFKATPSGALTLADFRNVWLEEEMDPPAFIKGKEKEEAEKTTTPTPTPMPMPMPSSSLMDETLSSALAEDVTTFLQNPQGTMLSDALNEAEQRRLAQMTVDDELLGLNEEELDRFILNEDEVRIKERVWVELNKEYLEAIAGKP